MIKFFLTLCRGGRADRRTGPRDQKDAARAAQIVGGLARWMWVRAVVAQGRALTIEALPGTQAMLEFAAPAFGAETRSQRGQGHPLQAPKPGQDRRIDLPTIGPDTVAQAAAGLGGIVWEAGASSCWNARAGGSAPPTRAVSVGACLNRTGERPACGSFHADAPADGV